MEHLWLFISISFLVSASPGPVMLSCMADAARFGVRASFFTMLGASLGNLLLVALSALGVGLLLREADTLFVIIQWLGAAYLFYLGASLAMATPEPVAILKQRVRRRQLFGKAFLVAATNPKGLIYFGALFPQFINVEQPIVAQFAQLTGVFLTMDLVWMLAYAAGGKLLMSWLETEQHQRWFNRLCGAALMLVGIGLVLHRV